jgi:hypothetical protein
MCPLAAKRLLELASRFLPRVTQKELAGSGWRAGECINEAIGIFIRLGWIEQHDPRHRVVHRTGRS